MITLIQRVTEAAVHVDGACIGRIGPGLLALVAVEPGDGEAQFARMTERLLGYRVFSDAAGKMNLGLAEAGGGLLLVPQFTLAADTDSGMRPSFTSAAPPELARAGFERLLALCRLACAGTGAPGPGRVDLESGCFGAHMRVSLVNDGPVTFRLRVPPSATR